MPIEQILKKLQLKNTGSYENHFYIINLDDSNQYAAMYTKLSDLATNTEYPSFGTNTVGTTVKITNYFEISLNAAVYNIFLIADFEQDRYVLKIGMEQK